MEQLWQWFLRTQKGIHGFICRVLYQHIFLSYLPEIVVSTTHKLISTVCISVATQPTLCYNISHIQLLNSQVSLLLQIWTRKPAVVWWYVLFPSVCCLNFNQSVCQVRRNDQPFLIYYDFLFLKAQKNIIKLQIDWFFLFVCLFSLLVLFTFHMMLTVWLPSYLESGGKKWSNTLSTFFWCALGKCVPGMWPGAVGRIPLIKWSSY